MIKNLLLTAAALCMAGGVMAQSIPNNGFENWTNTTYKNPQYYFASSFQQNNGYTNPVNVTQDSGTAYHGTYAVKLTTMLTANNDTAAAYFANGDPSHPAGQGIPYNESPTSMRLYYKCNVMPGDTAVVILMFKSGGVVISQNLQKITGVQTNYTLLTIPLSLAMTPDSLIFGAISSNILSHNFRGIPGSTITVDSVSFTGVTAQPLMLNGDFENWQSQTSHTLLNWSVQSSSGNNTPSSLQSTNAYAGNYAVNLMTMGTNNAGDTAYPATISTGASTNFGWAGGHPYVQTTDTLVFYYKFMPTDPNDSASVTLNFKKAGSIFQTQWQLVPASTNYAMVQIPFNLMQTPDSVIVSISSSKSWTVPPSYLGANLLVDDIYFKSQPTLLPGASLNFDGVNDYATISPATGINNQFPNSQITVEGWYFPTAYASASNPVPALVTEAYLGDGTVKFDMHLDGPAQELVGGFFDGSWHTVSAPYVLNQWQHYACTYDQQNLKLYINGVQVASMPLTNPLPIGTEEWRLGQRWDNPDFFQGNMDEVRIWNRALCQSEIQNNMQGQIASHQNGLVAYFKFNQGIDGADNSAITSLTDSTGNGYNATLNNFTLNGGSSNFAAFDTAAAATMATPFVKVVATQTNVTCNGGSNGAASVVVTGPASPFTYSWSPGAVVTNSITGVPAETVTCTISYACGTTMQTFTISEAPAITPTVTSAPVLCNGYQTTLTVSATGGTAPYTGLGTFSVSAGVYTYTVTDASNCSATTTYTVTQPATLMAMASVNNNIACNGGTTSIIVTEMGGTGPYTGDGTFTNMAAGTYSYIVTDNNMCTATATITLTQPNAITSTNSYTACAGSSVVVGTHTYTTAGTYTDVLTAANGCDSTVTTNLALTQVTAYFGLAAPTCSCTTVFCIDSSTVNNSDPIVSWHWVATGGYPTQTSNAQNPSFSLAFGSNTVCLTVTTQGGCTDSICRTYNQIIQGIGQYNYAPMLTLYPNPAQNNFTIQTNSTEKQLFEMFDVNGKLVLSQSINGTTSIDASNIAEGVYNISLSNSHGVNNKRLVIVK